MDNIFFSVTENDGSDDEKKMFDLNKLLNDLNDLNILNDKKTMDEDIIVSKIIDYAENYTVKELLVICDYYGIAKGLKQHKCIKGEIVHTLVIFEVNPMNIDIVLKRQNFWFYMDELKKDKFMKKHIIW
jgi:hypothetical protein